MNIPYGINGLGSNGFVKKPDMEGAKNRTSETTEKQAQVKNEDNITISKDGEILQQARNEASITNVFREEKVHNLQAEVEKGTYLVDSKKVALKIIKETVLDQLIG